MSKIGSWSTAAGNNNSTPPDGWPEGQAPSTVNDCAREMMASIRSYINDAQYVDLNNTPSFLTTTTFSLGASDVTTFHVGRRLKLFDTTTLYGTIDSVSATFVSVRLDSGALSTSLSSVAVAALSQSNNSLPDSVWGRRNLVINGCLDVWQRGNFFFPSNNAVTYTADRFAWLQSSTAAVNISRAQRSADTANVPTIAQAGMLLAASLCITVSAVDAAIGATEFARILYRVEGFDWRNIAHRPNVLSFWANSNRTGIYSVSLRNHPSVSTSFVQNYTIGAQNTWVRYSITIPEAPTTVTWNYSQSAGVEVAFVLAAGTTLQGEAGNWTATNILATSSQQNFLASAGNVFRITGVQLEAGVQATPLEIRHYGHELAMCHRYYWRGLPAMAFNFPAYTTNAVMSWPVSFPQTMRATATVATFFSNTTFTKVADSPSATQVTTNGFSLIATASGSSVNANFVFGALDYIEADAEL